MTLALLYLLLITASARIVRLITTDTITEPARTWVLRRVRRKVGKSLATGLSCPYCVGWWVSLALVLAVWPLRHGLPLPLLWPWAVAGGQTIISGLDLRLAEG